MEKIGRLGEVDRIGKCSFRVTLGPKVCLRGAFQGIMGCFWSITNMKMEIVIFKKLLKFKYSIRFEISAEFYPNLMYNMLKSDKN